MANKITITPEVEETTEKEVQPKSSRLTDTMKKMADFDFKLSNEWLVKQIPFGFFLVLLTALHIWNAHYTERLVRNTEKLHRENKELRSEYISIFSNLMSESKQSSVAQKLDTIGIKELRTPPLKITVTHGK